MPMVAVAIVVVLAGCGLALLVAAQSRRRPGWHQRRYAPQQDQTAPDAFTSYSAWQLADLTSSDSVVLPAATSDDRSASDDRPLEDNACRAEADNSSSFDVERDDRASSDSCSSDSSTDSGSDSSSSD